MITAPRYQDYYHYYTYVSHQSRHSCYVSADTWGNSVFRKLNLSDIAPQSCRGLFDVNYMTVIVCRSLFVTWYLWFMVLAKGWKNPIQLMMWAISGILQQVLQSSTLLLISVAPKGSSLFHARYSLFYSLCVPSLLFSKPFVLRYFSPLF